MNLLKQLCLCLAIFYLFNGSPFAFEHGDSNVHFHVYNRNIIQENRKQKKPYFLLFAAEWCHWCHIFAEKTLAHKKVYSYLNKNFVNIFIDADIHSGAYKKFKANGVPYIVFLNPDTSVFYQYSGALYAEPFLEVIQDVSQNIKKGLTVDGDEILPFEYTPPTKLKKSSIDKLRNTYIKDLLDNFDLEEYGLGKREKSILPETFLYLLKSAKGEDRQDAVLWISETLKKAIEKIYDPVEGGFFRFAEKKDWDIPHYEKMADLNAGIVLLLYKVDEVKTNQLFKQVAAQTIGYLSNTLYDKETGSFLSFQQADTSYYYLNVNRRKNVDQPLVIKKIFTDHLAITLNYLLDVLSYTGNKSLKNKVIRSLDFLSGMILKNKEIFHYYSIPEKQWSGKSGLQDHVLLVKLLQRAAAKFKHERYQIAASKIIHFSFSKYYNEQKQIFVDPELDPEDYEYLMEMNGNIALSLMEQGNKSAEQNYNSVKPLIRFFSRLDELLEDRFWDGKDWKFLERYALFLSAADKFLDSKNNPKN